VTVWELTRHADQVGMAQLPAHATVPRWALDESSEGSFWSVSRTTDELSVICSYDVIPGSVATVGPFTVFSVDGPLDHSLVGVLAGLLEPLSAAGISILAESTFDTDWILVPAAQSDEAAGVWTSAGHLIELEEPA
jgi:hypothetical protein